MRALLAHGNAIGIGAALTVLENAINNLPVALAAGTAIASVHTSHAVTSAAVIAVDLGPNLSISGSLATLLWVIALKRDGIKVSFWQFLTLGALVTTPALIAALLLAR
jgi:arsenical pump membrane protein